MSLSKGPVDYLMSMLPMHYVLMRTGVDSFMVGDLAASSLDIQKGGAGFVMKKVPGSDARTAAESVSRAVLHFRENGSSIKRVQSAAGSSIAPSSGVQVPGPAPITGGGK